MDSHAVSYLFRSCLGVGRGFTACTISRTGAIESVHPRTGASSIPVRPKSQSLEQTCHIGHLQDLTPTGRTATGDDGRSIGSRTTCAVICSSIRCRSTAPRNPQHFPTIRTSRASLQARGRALCWDLGCCPFHIRPLLFRWRCGLFPNWSGRATTRVQQPVAAQRGFRSPRRLVPTPPACPPSLMSTRSVLDSAPGTRD
jgi:hypothetical protein